ncbi:MAG: hypothetical protein ABFD92_01035 [Planctomycetaceae bacterium]|nr:hypothetical protein [Planctomycetaceae bacterium]
MTKQQTTADLKPQGKPSIWGRLARLIQRTPEWVIALTLGIGPFLFNIAGQPYKEPWLKITLIPLIIAGLGASGAIRRLKLLGIIIMCVGGALVLGLQFLIDLVLNIPVPYSRFIGPAVSVAIIGILEWAQRPPRQRAGLWAIGLCSLLVGGITGLICNLGDVWLGVIDVWGGSYGYPGAFIFPLLLTLLMWIFLPLAFGLSRTGTTPLRYAGVAASLISASLFFLVFCIGIHPLALRSLEGQGPLDPSASAWVLATRGRDSDFEAIWRQVEKADWSKPRDWSMPRPDRRREFLVQLLATHRPEIFAPRLARLLREKPQDPLAATLAPLMAEQKRYEAAAVLLWYAGQPHTGEECQAALEAMNLPCAAIRILGHASAFDRPMNSAEDFPINQMARDKLVRIFKTDAGAMFSMWESYLGKLDSTPSALPGPYQSEVDRVVASLNAWGNARTRLQRATQALYRRKLQQSGDNDLLQKAAKIHSLFQKQPRPSAAEIFAGVPDADRVTVQLDLLMREARAQMDIPSPQWREGGVESLEKDVRRYEEQVQDIIRMTFPAASQPTTRRTTNPH